MKEMKKKIKKKSNYYEGMIGIVEIIEESVVGWLILKENMEMIKRIIEIEIMVM